MKITKKISRFLENLSGCVENKLQIAMLHTHFTEIVNDCKQGNFLQNYKIANNFVMQKQTTKEGF
jgi:hypothetical protein